MCNKNKHKPKQNSLTRNTSSLSQKSEYIKFNKDKATSQLLTCKVVTFKLGTGKIYLRQMVLPPLDKKYLFKNGWMTCDFTSFSTVFQLYQDDGRMIMKGCVQWNPVYDSKDPRLRLELTTARSVGQRLILSYIIYS